MPDSIHFRFEELDITIKTPNPKSPARTSTKPADCNRLKKLIREVPDFPKKGILFYDITTLLKDRVGFARLIDALSQIYIGKEIDLVLGM